ncbi:MAG: HAD family phosphatase, partial [Bacillota bacterium]|nr:HAD family phosphatase [Bacillota bacterium]
YGAVGQASTLGGLVSKPHPWLYLEAVRVGLGLKEEEWQHVVCIEDSTAGVISAHLAGFAVLGLNTGNLAQSGVESLLLGQGDSLLDFLPLLI